MNCSYKISGSDGISYLILSLKTWNSSSFCSTNFLWDFQNFFCFKFIYWNCWTSILLHPWKTVIITVLYKLSHPNHPLRTHLFSWEHGMFYENRSLCIPNFGIRITNILSGTSFLGTRVRYRLHFLTWLLGTLKAFPLSILLNILSRPTPLLMFFFLYLHLTVLNATTTYIWAPMAQGQWIL